MRGACEGHANLYDEAAHRAARVAPFVSRPPKRFREAALVDWSETHNALDRAMELALLPPRYTLASDVITKGACDETIT